MKKFIIVALIAICAFAHQGFSQNYTKNGNTYTQSSSTRTSSEEKTQFTWKDSKKVEYPIYISKNGRCYIKRVSKNGNEYKMYLSEELSRDICKQLKREYINSK